MGLVTLATRWHGDNEPGTVYTKSREPGTRKPQTLELHPFLHPEPKEQPGTSKAGRGVFFSLSLSFGKGIVAPLPRPGLARAGRAAPNNSRGVFSVWGGG